MRKIAVLVLGAPRSGTSLISHIVCELGFYFGNQDRFVDPETHPWNPKFFELQSLNGLNDQIVSDFGHEYLDADWLPLKEDFTAEVVDRFRTRILDFIAVEFDNEPLIGLKDPRFCLTLPLWLAVLREAGYGVRLLWVVRDLAACLRSNKKLADDSSPMRPERLVTLSSLAAAHMLKEEGYYLCNYDDFVVSPDENVRNLSQWLECAPAKIEATSRVIQPALRHHLITQDETLSPPLAQLSSLLLSDDLKTEHYFELRCLLDAYGYLSLFRDKNRWLSALRKAIREKDAHIEGQDGLLAAKDMQIADLRGIVSSKEAELGELSGALAAKEAQIMTLSSLMSAKDIRIAGLDSAIDELMRSTSWRITSPLRILRRILGGRNILRAGIQKVTDVLHGHEALRAKLLRYGLAFYRNHMKKIRLGAWLGHQVLKRGYVSPVELQVSALSMDTQRLEKVGSHASAQIQAQGESVESDAGIPGFHLSPPLNLEISDNLNAAPRINVLLPSLRICHMSGGPNTALLFAALLAEKGERIRLIACDAPAEGEETALYRHMDSLLQRSVWRDRIELVDAFDRSRPTYIGMNDLFLATAWWTAQIAKYAVKKTIHKIFIYLIQDFEPILHEGSTFQARALETYGLPHIPLINTHLLLDHLIREGAGYYADRVFAKSALIFEPALDRNHYYPDSGGIGQTGKKVLLFYARPTAARRNLFEIGVVALRQAVASGVIDGDRWEVWAMGETLPPVALGHGVYLNPLPWMSFEDYAKRVRTADLMLSLMLSPHPSYPPLEMAASGKLVVTNSFSVKSAERMHKFSPNIIVVEPMVGSIGAALENAAGRINMGLPAYDASGRISLPASWDESLREVVDVLTARIEALRLTSPASTLFPVFAGYPALPKTGYENYRKLRLAQRRREGVYRQEPGLLSFITSAYNTAPEFLAELGNSLFLQDGGMNFEWLILDNGSTDEETCRALRELARHHGVRLERVEENLGIIGGMRYLLERARGRYVLPLDSDDLIEPDCVNVLTRFIHEHDYPTLLYTDEDKVSGNQFGSPYFKPDWDPVLFLNSCYIAHLCAIDREKALALELYSDKTAEGCHDWDSFIRFMNAGYTPCHIPEVLYSWRIHSGSTSGNIASKGYISDSHRMTLQRALQQRGAKNLDVVSSPLFLYNVDWWFRRTRDVPVSCHSIVIGNDEGGLAQLLQRVRVSDDELINLCWQGVVPDDDEWRWEAAGLIELFPDTVMVGGTLHDGTSVLGGPCLFGFGDGFDCPDRGRSLFDPGFSAVMFKARSVSAVSLGHCVVTRGFLLNVAPTLLKESVPLNMLGMWLGALAAEAGKRIVFSPFMRARATSVPENLAPDPARAHFLSRFWPLFPDIRYYSEKLGLSNEYAYAQVPPWARHRHLQYLQSKTLPYAEWLASHLRRRPEQYPLPDLPTGFALITTVYEATNIELLDELAESVINQSLKASEWVIVAHGPVAADKLKHIRTKASSLWNASVIVEPSPLGITGAMRVGLEAVKSDYIVPLDADDLLTHDALQILACAIDRASQPDLVYSDEDLLIDGKPAHPYLRPAFDPVLHLDSSYVWHLCAIKRERAVALDLYTDHGATWCHDWDSLTRVANSDGRIEHVPEVLYHWRQHKGSTTNNVDGDPRSLESVRHVLNQGIANTQAPHRYQVVDWPVTRGGRELYIARQANDLPEFIWVGDSVDRKVSDNARDSILVVAAKGLFVVSQQTYQEVARLFELHPRLGAIGGLVQDDNDVVVDACFMANNRGEMECPWLGMSVQYSGPYALALKPQIVSATGRALAFFRFAALESTGVLGNLGVDEILDTGTVCFALRTKGWHIGFSPLVKARSGPLFQPEPLFFTSRMQKTVIDRGGFVRYGRTLCFQP